MIDPITEYILQEQFDVSTAISAAKGEMNVAWTDCFSGRCTGLEKYDMKVCKSTCKITAMNAAIAKLNASRSGCSRAKNPDSCVNRLNKAADKLRSKISKENEMRSNAADKRATHRRKAAGGL